MNTSRTELLTGIDGIRKLSAASAAVFGLGGVGGYALEALVRAGIGKVLIADFDIVDSSNLNRQLLSLNSNIGKLKTDEAIIRMKNINPDIKIDALTEKLTPDNIPELKNYNFNYAVDAIDDVNAKLKLIEYLYINKIKFISSMGAGARLNPGLVFIDDISRTSVCPLAKKIRKRLKEYGITEGVKCVYSRETSVVQNNPDNSEKKIPSISYIPGIFGLFAAGEIINNILHLE